MQTLPGSAGFSLVLHISSSPHRASPALSAAISVSPHCWDKSPEWLPHGHLAPPGWFGMVFPQNCSLEMAAHRAVPELLFPWQHRADPSREQPQDERQTKRNPQRGFSLPTPALWGPLTLCSPLWLCPLSSWSCVSSPCGVWGFHGMQKTIP